MMEGIDDVIESMERFADRHWMHDEGQNVREFAQRLRAAKKACTAEATLPFDDLISRMKARCIDEKHSPELWPLIGELEAAVRKERDSRGNQEKMRSALELFVEYSELVCRMGIFNRDRLIAITTKARAALSEPARNCDLYKNKKDAEAAFISEKCKHPCGNCTVDDKYGCALVHECGVDWLFATAERKGEGK